MKPDMDDPFDLARFVTAQEGVFAEVIDELTAGRKQSHWMWFVFPQIAGLGNSAMAVRYAIGSMAEARAYLDHPVLGPRLRQCTALLNQVEGRTIRAILGQPDDMKFRSSVTLFSRATAQNSAFITALERYFGGEADQATLDRLAG